MSVATSPTLAINEQLQARQAAGEPVLHLGFGEAGLPVLPEVAERLGRAARRAEYAPVAGTPAALRAAAGYFTRRGLPTGPDQVVLAPGSKALLYALIACLPGDLVLPGPSWVSYAAQAALAGKRVRRVPVPEEAGGVPDPDLLDDALRLARRQGGRPGTLLLTIPDNPTGTVADPDLVRRVCAVAEAHDLVVVSDEIYRDLCYDPHDLVSPSHFVPDRCFVTTGLSKSMALGGWRIGCARLPDNELGARVHRDVVGLASEVWSSLARPMLDVAAYVFDEPPEVVDHVAAGRSLHQAVATAVHRAFVDHGARCRPPRAAFYVYPDLDPQRELLGRQGIGSGADLARHLLDAHGVGVLPGEAFGDDPTALRFRVATSLLYGRTDGERWAALRADDPLTLPWIDDALTRLRAALAALTTVAV
ncbi:MAG TPA: aminotransferase class I/II-fold pyridoxal phosphate-dependent enzyme [Acidimicrobiales bacterium]